MSRFCLYRPRSTNKASPGGAVFDPDTWPAVEGPGFRAALRTTLEGAARARHDVGDRRPRDGARVRCGEGTK